MAETTVNATLPGLPLAAARSAGAPGARGARRRRKAAEFWLYFAATLPIFLIVALVARLLPRAWRPFPTGLRLRVSGAASAPAYTAPPSVFMGCGPPPRRRGVSGRTAPPVRRPARAASPWDGPRAGRDRVATGRRRDDPRRAG